MLKTIQSSDLNYTISESRIDLLNDEHTSDSDEDQDEWETIYQEYDGVVGDSKFHFYETYGGGPSGGYAVLVDDLSNDESKVWVWAQGWGTEKGMRMLNSKMEIREDSENTCYRRIRII
jgi:hypothetical protein